MVEKNYQDMSYDELVAEKRKVNKEIEKLQATAHEISEVMNSMQSEAKLKQLADKLSPEEKEKLKPMLD